MQQPVSSLGYVKVQISATINGTPANPTTDTVRMAFPTTGADPTTWYPAAWETQGTLYFARCLVGPGGAVTLPIGFYDVYVQVVDSPEIPVVKATDTLEIF